MKNLLNNPWVVGALCVIALGTVYFRLFYSESKPALPVPVDVVGRPSPPPNAPVPAATLPVETVNNASRPLDSSTVQPITVGWAEALVRDPFQAVRQFDSFRVRGGEEGDEDFRQDENGDQRSVPSVIRLHAVFLDGPNRVAMINRELVKEGERINGYLVDRIQRDGVHLLGRDEDRWLDFGVPQAASESTQTKEAGRPSPIVGDRVAS